MTISTGDAVDKFGTPAAVDDGSTSSVANAAFSVAADATAWTNSDDAPLAQFLLTCQWATVTGVANKRVVLYARLMDVDSTTDAIAPSTNRKWQAIGAFLVYAAATGTDYVFDSGICRLPNAESGQIYEFYLENLTGQTISAGWGLKITPMSVGPAP